MGASEQWHWTTLDVSRKALDTLKAALSGSVPDLQGLLLKVNEVKAHGECSIDRRKNKVFLVYQLVLDLQWAAEAQADDGSTLDSASGRCRFSDVSPETLDDLASECVFEASDRDAKASQAVRKRGIPAIVRLVRTTLDELLVRESAEKPAPQQEQQPRQAPHPPQPLTVSKQAAPPAATVKSAAAPVTSAASPAEPPPLGLQAVGGMALAAAVNRMKAHPKLTTTLRLTALMLDDDALPPLIEVLHHSYNCLETLDLSFNRLTDRGVGLLLSALSSGGAPELAHLSLGGNSVEPDDALLAPLRQARPEVAVSWASSLHGATQLCLVGTVYKNSPASRAGLFPGDRLMSFGPLQGNQGLAHRFGFQMDYQQSELASAAAVSSFAFSSVSASISPMVRACLGIEIDVVVERAKAAGEGNGAGERCLQRLTLTPARWSGSGLLGCVLK